MNDQQMIDVLNEDPPAFIKLLRGHTTAINAKARTAEMAFNVSQDCCHSGYIVHGAFITGMLDAVMAQAVFGTLQTICPLPSLDIRVSFIAPSLAGDFTANGRVVSLGKSIVFLEAQLFDGDATLTATANSTTKIVRKSDIRS